MLVVGIRGRLFRSEGFEVLILDLLDALYGIVAVSVKCT